MKIFKQVSFLILFIAAITILFSIPALAGNNDSLPSFGYSGKADENWQYTSQKSAMRISIYWAPPKYVDEDGKEKDPFVTGEGVIQIGNTVDVSKTGPWYKVDIYTGYTSYWYMNKDDLNMGNKYKSTESSETPYTWAGFGDTDPEILNIVNKMPDVWKSTKEDWDEWFEDPVAGRNRYTNIPAIAKLCGADLSIEDFKSGFLDLYGYQSKGQYKIFFEPVIYLIMDGVSQAMTLRDLIRWEEAFQEGKIVPSDGKNALSWIAPAYVFTANAQFLIMDEACICMKANKDPVYHVKYTGSPSQREEIRRQIQKGGKIYNTGI